MKYKHVSQKPYGCVPACVQMILWRRKILKPPLADIAYDLGIVLPPGNRHLWPKSDGGRKPKAGWGTRLNLKKYSLPQFFKRRNYPLQATFRPAEKLKSTKQFKKFLSENIKKSNDLLVCFNYPKLYHLAGSWGHASLVERANQKYVNLRDPIPQYQAARRILPTDLLAALKNHYRGGIWVIKGTPAVKP